MSTDRLFVAVFISNQNFRYAFASAYTVQVYELFALLSLEWEFMRGQRWSGMLAAYIWCRCYPIVAVPIIMAAYLGNYPVTRCKPMIIATNVLYIPFYAVPQAVMALRAYAFARRGKGVFFLLFIPYCALIGVDCWTFLQHSSMLPPSYYEWVGPHGTGCFPDYGTGAMHVQVGIIKLSEVAMDLVSLFVVLYHCRTSYKGTKGLATYFLNQGLMYFAAMAVTNLVCAIFYYQRNTNYDRVFLPFILVIPGNIACRVILHLREHAGSSNTTTQILRNNSNIVNNALVRLDRYIDQWTIHNHNHGHELGHSDDEAPLGSKRHTGIPPVVRLRPLSRTFITETP